MRSREEVVKWLKYIDDGEISEVGKDVAWLLEKMWGLHNISRDSLNKVDWSNEFFILFPLGYKTLSTIDNADLTRLVVICHQMMLRVEIRPRARHWLELVFHQRDSREIKDGIHRYCPDILEHVTQILSKLNITRT